MKIFKRCFDSSNYSYFQRSSKKNKQSQAPSSGSGSSPSLSSSFSKANAAPHSPTSVVLGNLPDNSPAAELPPKITKKEWELVLRLLRKSGSLEAEDAAFMMRLSDGDGIYLDDFEAISSAEEELREAFRVFDADGDGKISAEELLGVFLTLGDDGRTLEDCRRMIGVVAPLGGGFVCFDDFASMMSCDRSV